MGVITLIYQLLAVYTLISHVEFSGTERFYGYHIIKSISTETDKSLARPHISNETDLHHHYDGQSWANEMRKVKAHEVYVSVKYDG